MKKLIATALISFAALSFSPMLLAQGFPSHAIRMVVPYSAGGLPDIVARLVAQKMNESTGQPVIVDNKPGAGGLGATQEVVRSPADGYTLLVTDGSQMTVNPHLYTKLLTYDPMTSLAPVSLIGEAPLFLTINASSPFKTVSDMVAAAKAKPGAMNYGSSGIGSVPHLAEEAFNAAGGMSMVHVPYKGSAQVVPAIISDEIVSSMLAMSSALPQVNAGRLRLLAVSAPQRSKLAPDVPTFAEAGFTDFNFQPRIGVVAPVGIPAPVMAVLTREVMKASKSPDVVKKLGELGIDAVGSTAEQYAVLIKGDFERYRVIVQTSGIKPD